MNKVEKTKWWLEFPSSRLALDLKPEHVAINWIQFILAYNKSDLVYL